VRNPDGSSGRYSDGFGHQLLIQIHDGATVRRLVYNPELALGDAYLSGMLTIENDILLRLPQDNVAGRARRNIAHHYDLFLDANRQYSCSYFLDQTDTLEQAQSNKKHHIARNLRITPGMRVLDIGCGWGGLARMFARDYTNILQHCGTSSTKTKTRSEIL
jgi:cyclopropane-fatty-acyl-phospholipid synthase